MVISIEGTFDKDMERVDKAAGAFREHLRRLGTRR